MSSCKQQAQIDAPLETVWALIADVNRHPEWWPRVVEVECEGLERGCTYRQVFQTPLGAEEMRVFVDRLEDCQELFIRCLDTGTYARMVLTEARGGTFVDAEAGMDPKTIKHQVIDGLMGKRFFRRWLDQSLDALGKAASKRRASEAV
jgi:uncharacterized protein YndB with AHSA1/START domain